MNTPRPLSPLSTAPAAPSPSTGTPGVPSPVPDPAGETVFLPPPAPIGLEHDLRNHAMGVIIGLSAVLMVVAVSIWQWSPSPSFNDLPEHVPVARGTQTVTTVGELTDEGRASLVRAQRAVEEHVSLRIQAQGARDLVQAWAARSGAQLGKVQVVARKGASQCSTTVTHGVDRNHAMIGHASDPIAACRALIAGMEARYPDLAQTDPDRGTP